MNTEITLSIAKAFSFISISPKTYPKEGIYQDKKEIIKNIEKRVPEPWGKLQHILGQEILAEEHKKIPAFW